MFKPKSEKRHREMTKATIKYYHGQGYTEEHDFPGEYMLLVNPRTMDRARVYYNSYQVTETPGG